MKKHLLAITALASLTLSGCVKNAESLFKDIRVEPNVSFPAGSISITDSSLFAMANIEEGIKVNSDGVLTFNIKQEVKMATTNFDEILDFPMQNLNFNVPIPGSQALPFPPGTLVPIEDLAPEGLKINLKLNVTERIDLIEFNEGFIKLLLDAPSGYDLTKLVCTIENLKRNGVTLAVHNDERIDFGDGAKYTLEPHNNMITLSFSGQIPVMNELKGGITILADGFEEVKGFFGHKTINPFMYDLKIDSSFTNFTNMVEDIYFADPEMSLYIDNKIDAPLLLTIEKLEAKIKTASGALEVIEMQFKQAKNLVYLSSTGEYRIKLNNESFVDGTPDLSEILDKGLELLTVRTNMILNPTKDEIQGVGPDPKPEDKTVNTFDADAVSWGFIEVDVPLDGTIKNMKADYTVKIDLSSYDNNETKIQELSTAFYGKNGLPMDISLMAEVREGDKADGLATPLFDKPIIFPASNGLKPDDPAFRPGQILPTEMPISVIKPEAVSKLLKAKILFLNIKGSTYNIENNAVVKFYSPTSLNVNLLLGLKADLLLQQSSNQEKE